MRFISIFKFKILVISFLLSLFSSNLLAQTSDIGIFFQAVARDNFSNPAKDRKIYVQSTILQSTPTGTKLLVEDHQTKTDASGVFNISIGQGTRVGGVSNSLISIDWSNGPFYLNLKVSITPIAAQNGWDYKKEWIDMGTTSFGAVPYAFFSASSAKDKDKLDISDTASMLSNRFARDTAALSSRIDLKVNIADTASMLSNRFARDTASLSNRINLKVNIFDTASMLSNRFASR